MSSKTLFADQHLEIVTDVVQTPVHAEPKPWTIVHRKAAVIVAAMTRAGKFLLVRQERVPIRAAIWEMPAGQIDDVVAGDGDPGHTLDQQTIEATALRELREETGHDLADEGELLALGHYFSSPGFTDEHGYFFLARPVEPCRSDPERDEAESILDCRAFTVAELRRMIAENEIRDANTLSICARLATRGLLELEARN